MRRLARPLPIWSPRAGSGEANPLAIQDEIGGAGQTGDSTTSQGAADNGAADLSPALGADSPASCLRAQRVTAVGGGKGEFAPKVTWKVMRIATGAPSFFSTLTR